MANQPDIPSQPGNSGLGLTATASASGLPSGVPSASGLGVPGSTTSTRIGQQKREAFAPDELAIVLSHYDLGIIEAIQEYPRGSRRAPKAIIRSERGIYLLKRRARGKDNPFKVAFCHALQLYLASKQFPLPHLVGTRKDNNSMLQHKGAIYELFEYIKGSGYDNSLRATGEAGKTLALFHKLLSKYQPEYDPPTGSYHASRSIAQAIGMIPASIEKLERPSAADDLQRARRTLKSLHASYNDAAARVNEIGLGEWPTQIVHADWHPGNMLFRGSRIVAVIDYDAARIQQRVLDVANGALQFSIIGGGDDTAQWPDYIDESRFKRFLRGYDTVPNCVLSRAELRAIVPLMIEALIAECVIPIAATGTFARMEGAGFLEMIQRKVRWLEQNGERLTQSLEG